MTDPREGAPGETPDDAESADEPIADEATDDATEDADAADAAEATEPVPVVPGDPVEADPDLGAPARRLPRREREREARARAAAVAAPVPSPWDQTVHIDDRIPKLFVLATVLR